MDTHKMLMVTVVLLALVHAALSGFVLAKRETLSAEYVRNFLIVSVVVCLLVAVLAGYCMYM